MKERGILFSAPMIRALRANLKTQTRRLSRTWLRVKKGDRLYTRETWHPCDGGPIFAADSQWEDTMGPDARREMGVERWFPSIFLRREDSRDDLEATEDARLVRLRDITEADAKAEGVQPEFEATIEQFTANGSGGIPPSSYVLGFKHAWDRINPEMPWKSNPEVVRLAFKRVRP